MTASVPRVYNKRRAGIPVDAVYVGRPTKWGNPFVVGVHGTREEVIERYEHWIQKNRELMVALHELRGKDLVCWCAPLPCHADVLVRLANV